MFKFLSIFFLGVCLNLHATTILDLFEAINHQPISKLDNIHTHIEKLAKDRSDAAYYPIVNGFAAYTHYNSPTNMRPVDPISSSSLMADDQSIPFSKTIEKFGVNFSVPIFMKELSDLSHKTEFLLQSSKLKKRLNYFQNEAIVLGANANLQYLENLISSLYATKQSILSTKKRVEVGVDIGRTPIIVLDKLEEKLNQLDISINNIKIKELELISTIENLTGIELKKSVSMQRVSSINKNEFFALKPLEKTILASKSDLKATKAKRYYPKVSLSAMWSENYASHDVYKDDDVHVGYGYYELGVLIPLYNKEEDVSIQLKKIAIMKNKMQLEKTKKEIKTTVKALEKNINLLEHSEKLNDINIKKREKLLKYAKVAYEQGRMIEEDYLSYEDKLLSAKANYFETISQKWQSIAKLSVIYGNDLKGIVR